MPSNEQLEEIVRWRLAGSFSDKTSDLMVGRGGRGRRGARPRPRAPAPEEQMVGDDPFARGPFTLEGFSREVVRPASREQEAPVEEVEDDERAYMARPYIQLYNQLSNLQLEVRMGGTVRVTNDPITRNCEYFSSFVLSLLCSYLSLPLLPGSVSCWTCKCNCKRVRNNQIEPISRCEVH